MYLHVLYVGEVLGSYEATNMTATGDINSEGTSIVVTEYEEPIDSIGVHYQTIDDFFLTEAKVTTVTGISTEGYVEPGTIPYGTKTSPLKVGVCLSLMLLHCTHSHNLYIATQGCYNLYALMTASCYNVLHIWMFVLPLYK